MGAVVLRPYMTVLITGGTETEWVCLGEEGLEDLGTVVEDAADVGGDEEAIDDGAAQDGVVDVIGDLGAAVLWDEAMFVAPEAVGAAELFVDEAVGRIPRGDFAFPGDGDSVEAKLVADARAGLHFDGIRSDDVEFEEGRSEALEIVGVGEEGEDFVDGAGEEDGAVDGEEFHMDTMMASRGWARFSRSAGEYT